MKLTNQQKNSIPFTYAQSVLDGKIVVGKRIKQAVERFYSWIETADEDGYYLDHKKGMTAINFFPTLLNHTKGDMVGKPFVLAPFQQFTLYNIFGWLHKETKLRRIRKVYDKRGRGNGKTAEMAGICLLMQSFEQESESEVYIAATKEAQAKICWSFARNYIEHPMANPVLKELGFYCKQREIIFKPLVSSMMPLGGDSKTQDGLSAHFVVIDEYHAHPNDALKEVLESSMLKRSQPLTYQITTAGFNTASVCKQYEDMCIDVLNGDKKDDSLFIMIHDLDEDDDWQDQSNWIKANPLWDYGLNIAELKAAFLDAKNQPSKSYNFKTKHLNQWVDAPTVWIPTEVWNKNEIQTLPLSAFENYGSYAGLDMSSTTDFTAYASLSEPDNNDIRYLHVDLFCPEDTIDTRSKEDRVPYRQWRDQGYIISTPGDVVDHKFVFQHIIKNRLKYKNKRIEIDRALATTITTDLMDAGMEVSWFNQSIMNMTTPTKEFEKLIYQGKIKYQKNPVLKWMLSGCVKYSDANENVKIHKGKSHEGNKRVDGIIASIMALGGSLSMKEKPSKYSKPQDNIYV